MTLPEIALLVAECFPELGGKALAVVGVDLKSFKDEQEGIATPYALIGLDQGDTGSSGATIKDSMSMRDTFVIEFAFDAVKYERKDGTETPLWAYYDYEKVRDRLFQCFLNTDYMFEYVSIDISTDQRGVYIEFTFRQVYEWCNNSDDSADGEGQPLILNYTLNGC